MTPKDRQKRYRDRQKALRQGAIPDENVTAVTSGITPTDQMFEADRPGYYIFEKTVFEKQCWECSKAFSTTMLLNRFCSPHCKQLFLDKSFSLARAASHTAA